MPIEYQPFEKAICAGTGSSRKMIKERMRGACMTIRVLIFPLLVLTGFLALTLMPLNSAHAGPLFPPGGSDDDPVFAEDACDPEYYESLRSRAWLEAQREITQNQNLIAKPDSVLEYTCFDEHLNHMAMIAENNLFLSQTDRWGRPPGNMENALSLLTRVIRRYQSSNFNHRLLGGRYRGPDEPDPDHPSYHVFSGSMSPGSYACNTMNRVWEVAKCMDFIDSSEHDGFFSFEDYANNPDRRFLAPACTHTAPFEENINRAYMDAGTPWTEDPIDTYFNLIYPEDEGCGDESSVLSTGLLITRTTETPNEYNEHICVVPGCYYQPTGEDSGECVRTGS